MRLLITISFLLLVKISFAQLQLKGKVIDKQTGKALQGVSIFINNTSFGTVTGVDGTFVLNTSLQKVELIGSFIGYATYTQTFTKENTGNYINIALQPKAKELEDFIVKAYEKDGWTKWGKFFTDNFIGTGANSKNCIIENTKIIKFRNDKANNTLEVIAQEPLIIKNKALGYTLVYDMQGFTYNFKSKILFYSGYPFFTEMKGRTGQIKRWNNNRKEAYEGSLMHFMRSLYRNTLTKENFIMHHVKRVYNTEKERIKPFYAKRVYALGANNVMTERTDDTARYYKSIMQQPDFRNYLDTNPVVADSIAFVADTAIAGLSFADYLQVTYLKKEEPEEFAQIQGRKPANVVSSLIILLNNPVLFIYSNGMYFESTDLLSEGFWSWSEKICNMLPYDYK